MLSRQFGSARYIRTFKKRPHISMSKMEPYSGCGRLPFGEFFSRKDYNSAQSRYVFAQSLVYDILLSVFDVNTRAVAVARFTDFLGMEAKFSAFVKSVKRPNFEVRVIGMQNGQETSQVYSIADFVSKRGLHLFEADLFGTDARHIAVDTDTGMCFNVLLEDRLYKPGELTNSMTIEQFQRSLRGEPFRK